MSRKIRIQIALFLVIAVAGISYAGAEYVGLGRYLFGTGYTVAVRMADAGGVFENAEVTYRGVSVGRVTSMDLADDGIEVRLHIDDSAPPIPATTRAAVTNRSAVGEQYIDLLPETGKPPYLSEGSVIPEHRTSTPPPPESVLSNLNTLMGSVPPDSLRTVVDELGTAFRGTGPSLERMLDGTNAFVAEANQHVPQTRGLLANGRVVLDTQRDQANQITELGSGLRQISAQLEESNPDVRTVLREAPATGRQVNDVLRTSGGDMGMVMANMLTTAQVTSVRTSSMEQLLVTFPVISSFTHSLAPDGTGHLGAVFNVFNPENCTKGYEGTLKRPGNDTAPIPPNSNVGCAEPPGDATSVRGAQNAPRADVPREVPRSAPDDSSLPLPVLPR